MSNELQTVATALYVKVDNALMDDQRLTRWRPAVGIAPKLSRFERVLLRVTLIGDIPVGTDGQESTLIEGEPFRSIPIFE